VSVPDQEGAAAAGGRARRVLLGVELAAAAFCLVVIVACLATQTLTRLIPGVGWHWTGELARYAFVWSALLGTAAALEAGALHRFDFVTRRLPAARRRLAEGIATALVAATLVYMTYYGIVMAERVAGQHSSMLRISMTWVYAALPVASALMLISLGLERRDRSRRAGRPASAGTG